MKITPEKLVEKKVLLMCLELNLSVEIYDSKGQYSEAQEVYTSNLGMQNGTPDLMGCDRYGHFVAIELKAPLKENLCTLDQRNFLKRKIESNGFGVVVSCEQKLKQIYLTWLSLSLPERRSFLLDLLPKKVSVKIGKNKKKTISVF